MTNKKISQLPTGSSIVSGNLFAIVQQGTTYQASASQILDYITSSVINSLDITYLTASFVRINNDLTIVGDLAVNGGDITSTTSVLKLNEGKIVSGTAAQFTSITASHVGSGAGLTNIPNSATTATSTNIANAIVARDAFGNFTAGTITASLFGNASTAKTAQTASILQTARTISSTGDITWSVTFDGSGNASGIAQIAAGVIQNNDISATAGIVDTKLATISTAGKVLNSATTATSTNIANAIVARDAFGNFTAGTITASLFGNASTVTNGVYTAGDQTINGIKSFNSPLTGTTAYFSGDVVINGTASIAQLNTVNQTSLVVGDKYITILSGGVNHTGIDGAGILWGTSSGPSESTGSLGEHAHMLYDASRDALKVFPGLYVSGNTNLFSISGTTAQFTVLTASYISASQYFGPIGGGSGDVSAAGTNNFSGINTFSNNYITASAGITGSDAKFTSITGSLFGTASYAINSQTASIVISGAYTNASNTFNNINKFDNHYITASIGITGSDAKFTTITASILSASQIIGIAGGSGPESSVQFKTGSQLSGTSKFNYNSATETLNVENIFITGAIVTAIYTVTQSGLILDEYHTILADSTLSPIILTLPSASNSEGRELTVKKVDLTSNIITISASVGDTIDNYQYLQLDTEYRSFILKSDGFSKWLIFGETSAELNIIAQGYINLPGTNDFYILSSSAANGPNKSIQFNYFDILSGTSNLIYESNTLTLSGVNAQFNLLSSSVITGSDAKFTSITGNLNGRLSNLTTFSAVKNSNYSLGADDHVIFASASISNIFITLPDASTAPYRQFIIKKIDSTNNKIIISGTSAQTIDGNLGREINTQYETVTVMSDGISQWFIL